MSITLPVEQVRPTKGKILKDGKPFITYISEGMSKEIHRKMKKDKINFLSKIVRTLLRAWLQDRIRITNESGMIDGARLIQSIKHKEVQ